jgi:redox-sensitive bicupin YhaK (pirin superfamily)
MAIRRLLIALTTVNILAAGASIVHSSRLAAASEPDTLRARTIELVDQHGQVRAQLKVETDGEAVFRLRDQKGEIRVKLAAGGDGSGLVLLDGSTEPAIHMLAKDAGTSVTLRSKEGQRRVITP